MADRRKLVDAMKSLADGDFTTRLEDDGADDSLASAFNRIAAQNQTLCNELQRLAEVVGKEGKIGERGKTGNLDGGWRIAMDSVNDVIEDTVQPSAEVARVIGAVAKGDLSQLMAEDIDGRPLRGEFLRIGKVVNKMVLQLDSFADEVTRVAREVGTEGKLGGQARVRGVAGTWKDLTDNVNAMAGNLTSQVRNIAEVTTAVAKGDLSKKITVDVKGEIAELKDTVNTMVDQLNRFASEVTRVAREVGTEGKLGGQAEVEDVAGTWADLTDSVNQMAGNLTDQVRNIADVTTAVATGDLSKKITVEVRGEMAELKSTVNTMVDQLNSFASEVTRVAREVGTDGKLGGQAKVEGVGGTWKDLTDNVNELAANLTGQVRNIAEVTTAVARGDLSKKITVDVKGEIAELKDTINTMVDQLNSFAAEVTRVAREVGTDGKLGGQAKVEGVGGVWQDLTDNVNELAANLTSQVRNIADVTTAVARGDLSKKITVEVRGEVAELKNTINTMVDQLNAFAYEVTRVAREVGTEGNLGGQAQVRGVGGTWKDLTDNVNLMAENLTGQVRNIAAVTTAVARGDLSKKITVDVKGEIAELKDTINTMVDQLNGFAAEVTRVAREVGTEGKLGGQAQVPGVGGTWKDLTDNVNQMGTNLTNQVRGIAEVVTAVAQGDLKRKLTLEAKGEIASLAETINFMIDTLSTFGDQVTSMAREVGIEGRLGGQASVPGAAGLWRDLTDNVNQLAANLTNQVRAIAEVATAVTKGDLTRSIAVQAEGEMAALKDNINEMISNLKEQTLKNAEQDWLKTNLARFSRLLQGERELTKISRLIMTELAPLMNAQHGAFYIATSDIEGNHLRLAASYGVDKATPMPDRIEIGETLVGQCAADKRPIWIDQAPEDFAKIGSSLGKASPASIVILPALFEDEVKGVIELASLRPFNDTHQAFLDQFMESVGVVLNTIAATSRTETLLEQSQRLTTELQSRQTELTTKQEQLHTTNEELQEKAEQLQLTSRYKSEFLANMSHELRTPLNSLLILSKLLSENPDGNLSSKQMEFARTIHSAGSDLLSLINDILDLSKIESGTVSLDVREVALDSLARHVERTFAQVATNKSLDFTVEMDDDLPEAILSDGKRVQQVVLNLLSNAFKFTSEGGVTLSFERAESGWLASHPVLSMETEALRISVTDTGIGIPKDKQRLIFEAFQQADGTTSRKFGGTGLGLSISREIAAMLGGDLTASSEPGQGSTFSLYLPYKIEPAVEDKTQSSVASIPGPRETDGMYDLVPADRALLASIAAPDSRTVKSKGKAKKRRVALLVSGDEKLIDKVAAAASAKQINLVTAQTPGQALSLCERDDPALLLVDRCIETVNPDVIESLFAAHEMTRKIPRLVLTPSKKEAGESDVSAISRRAKQATISEELKRAAAREVEIAEELATYDVQEQLVGKHVLVIDDDIRNIFSLTSVIENEGGSVSYAESGAAGIDKLENGDDVDALLVDIMMPEMDGYETIRAIRRHKRFAKLPIIAVTAKAMVGDRQRCIEAGADDYIAKPVNIDLLLAALRVWTKDNQRRDAA